MVKQKRNGRGNNKNTTTTRIWSKTLREWEEYAKKISPFQDKRLSMPETFDIGIKKLKKKKKLEEVKF